MECFGQLGQAPRRIALPDLPTPTSQALTKAFYKRADDIVSTIGEMLGRNIVMPDADKRAEFPHDVPGEYFKGPF
jgi:pyruvate dehydrogenase E1 component beta subunit